MGYRDKVKFEVLKGKTLTEIEVSDDKTEVTWRCSDGTSFFMYHDRDCCETVELYDICGDLSDLLNTEILLAEEVTSEEHPGDFKRHENAYEDSFTWTFYKLSTIKGSVTLRWLGESNGYYSESVSFEDTTPEVAA